MGVWWAVPALSRWGEFRGRSLRLALSPGLEVPGSKLKSSEEDWDSRSPVCFSRLLRSAREFTPWWLWPESLAYWRFGNNLATLTGLAVPTLRHPEFLGRWSLSRQFLTSALASWISALGDTLEKLLPVAAEVESTLGVAAALKAWQHLATGIHPAQKLVGSPSKIASIVLAQQG